MRNNPSNDMIRRALDAQLSGVKETPGLYDRVVRQTKGEKPMKKKMSLSLALAAALVMLAGIAVAANWQGVSYFLTERLLVPETVVETSVVQPLSQSCDSDWLSAEVVDAYWTDYAFSLTLHVQPKDASKALCMDTDIGADGETFDKIWWKGEILDLEQWRAGREVLRIGAPGLNLGGGSHDWTGSSCDWIHEEDDSLTVLLEIRDADENLLTAGGEHTISLYCDNMQTGEIEQSQVKFTLPAMTKEHSLIQETLNVRD